METAGTAIRMAREALGWTVADLARRAACDPSYLGRIERGERTPTVYFIAHVSQIMADHDVEQAS